MITGGNPVNGYVLTTNALGLASWRPVSSSTTNINNSTGTNVTLNSSTINNSTLTNSTINSSTINNPLLNTANLINSTFTGGLINGAILRNVTIPGNPNLAISKLVAPDGSPNPAVQVDNDGNTGLGTAVPSALVDIGGGVRNFIDGINDLLVKGDAEIDGAIFASSFTGSGAGLTNISGGNITGSVANATNAVNAQNAINSTNAVNAQTATTATNATNAVNAQNAVTATNATNAVNASNVTAGTVSNSTITGGVINGAILRNVTIPGNPNLAISKLVAPDGAPNPAVQVDNNGNTGVGTATPTSLLDVGGGVRNFVDGVDDVLVKDDVEIDGTLFASSASVGGTVTATSFSGSGAGLTSISGANITGTVANAQNAVNAQNATNAQNAVNATNAQNAVNAQTATSATNAQTAVNATNASNVTGGNITNSTITGGLINGATLRNVNLTGNPNLNIFKLVAPDGAPDPAVIVDNVGNTGIGTTLPTALADIGGGIKNFIDGVNDILVKDDAEIDGTLFASSATIGGNVTATSFSGSGAGLTNIAGANVTGTVANATNAVNATNATNAVNAQTATNATNAVNATNVTGGTITSSTIRNGTINGSTLLNVTLGNNSVNQNALANNSVFSRHIVNGTIITADLADASVTDPKIVSVAGSKVTGTVANATNAQTAVTATNATNAQNAVNATNVTGGTITSSTIRNGTINGSTLINVTLGNNSVNQNALTNNSVFSRHIVNGTIITADLADASVTDPKIVSVAGSKVTGNVNRSTFADNMVGGSINSAIITGGIINGATLRNVTLPNVVVDRLVPADGSPNPAVFVNNTGMTYIGGATYDNSPELVIQSSEYAETMLSTNKADGYSTIRFADLAGVDWSFVSNWPSAGAFTMFNHNAPANVFAHSLTATQGGNVGIANIIPQVKLDVAGEVRVGNTGIACTANIAGSMRYNSTAKVMEFCDGSNWLAFGAGGSTGSGASDNAQCSADGFYYAVEGSEVTNGGANAGYGTGPSSADFVKCNKVAYIDRGHSLTRTWTFRSPPRSGQVIFRTTRDRTGQSIGSGTWYWFAPNITLTNAGQVFHEGRAYGVNTFTCQYDKPTNHFTCSVAR
jgi:hypothetical protein